MSWTDKKAVSIFRRLAAEFGISTLIETGTYKGIGAKLMAHYFDTVMTCEIDEDYLEIARGRLCSHPNVFLVPSNSPAFLRNYARLYGKTDPVLFYLDAHFYDPELPVDKRFVVVEELQELEGFENCVIAIHDYAAPGLGHIVYDGRPLDWKIVGEHIQKVNPNFHYYHNTRQGCAIVTELEVKGGSVVGLDPDADTLNNIQYAWKEERLTYRGFLYATPRALDLTQYPELVEFIPE